MWCYNVQPYAWIYTKKSYPILFQSIHLRLTFTPCCQWDMLRRSSLGLTPAPLRVLWAPPVSPQLQVSAPSAGRAHCPNPRSPCGVTALPFSRYMQTKGTWMRPEPPGAAPGPSVTAHRQHPMATPGQRKGPTHYRHLF